LAKYSFCFTGYRRKKRKTGIKEIKKKRIDSWTIKIKGSKDLKKLVKGRIIGMVDDILETGGTLVRFYDEYKNLEQKTRYFNYSRYPSLGHLKSIEKTF